MTDKKNIIIHCPYIEDCAKPILKDAVLSNGTRFIMRCPWCVRVVSIRKTERSGISRVMRKELSTDLST